MIAFDLATVFRRIDGVLLARQIGEDRRHVLRDLAVDREQVDVEAAARFGVHQASRKFATRRPWPVSSWAMFKSFSRANLTRSSMF